MIFTCCQFLQQLTGITLKDVVDDYDGKQRPQGSGYDIGVYEYLPNRINAKSLNRS